MNTTLKTSFTAALPRARLAVRSFVGAQASIWTKRRVIAIVAPQFLISVLLLLASGRAVWATTYTWASGVNGAWSDAADWTPSGGPPGPNDTAVISSGTVTVGSAVTVAEAIMSGGTLTGSPVTVTGPFYWSGGDIENTVQFYGGTNGGYCYLDGGKIINEGTWDWNG
ncbi:MAG TPA: hypothetical protein VMF08_19750, partial [Candidatus Sulfotelmatobacter sp.]|nr:hypothetical protein [Candidatus Sulfotelmatobacter sp.]